MVSVQGIGSSSVVFRQYQPPARLEINLNEVQARIDSSLSQRRFLPSPDKRISYLEKQNAALQEKITETRATQLLRTGEGSPLSFENLEPALENSDPGSALKTYNYYSLAEAHQNALQEIIEAASIIEANKGKNSNTFQFTLKIADKIFYIIISSSQEIFLRRTEYDPIKQIGEFGIPLSSPIGIIQHSSKVERELANVLENKILANPIFKSYKQNLIQEEAYREVQDYRPLETKHLVSNVLNNLLAGNPEKFANLTKENVQVFCNDYPSNTLRPNEEDNSFLDNLTTNGVVKHVWPPEKPEYGIHKVYAPGYAFIELGDERFLLESPIKDNNSNIEEISILNIRTKKKIKFPPYYESADKGLEIKYRRILELLNQALIQQGQEREFHPYIRSKLS